MKQREKQFVVEGLRYPTRLDKVVRAHFPRWGRRAVQSTINAGHVRVNARKVWLCSWKVQNGDQLEITNSPPNKIPSPAVFDDRWLISVDSDLIVVNKPAGLLSQSTRWKQTNNLLDLAANRFGPVTLFHRLDRDTSGLILFTRPGPINRYLDTALKAGTIIREYTAVVCAPNKLDKDGIIRARIGPHLQRRDKMMVVKRGGKGAITRYQVMHAGEDKEWLRLWPETGRTHQLRVHLQSMKAPILGDRLYNPHYHDDKRLMLHACQISLPQADGFPERVFLAPIPDDFLASDRWPMANN